MKYSDLENRLKIDPNVNPLYKRKILSNLNYLEIGAVVLGVGILILVLINIRGGGIESLDDWMVPSQLENEIQKNELIYLREKAGVNLLSDEEKQEQLSELDGIRSQIEISPLSTDEKQQQLDELNKLRNLNY